MMAITNYQVDHLFLLTGQNPLPNAVAALTLLRSQGVIYLVHTTFTAQQAQRLRELFTSYDHIAAIAMVDLGQDQAEASVIYQAIANIAQDLKGKVGMNYTGGTKSMAVHAYRIIAQLYPQAVFSYLDSNSMEMVIDNISRRSDRLKVRPKLSLAELFKLHGLQWRKDNPPLTSPLYPEAAIALAKLHQNPHHQRAWRTWCNKELRRQTQSRYGSWKSEWQLSQTPPLSLQYLPQPFKTFCETYLGATNETLDLKSPLQKGFANITQLCSWLDGIWLEHFTLKQIQNLNENYKLYESALSFRVSTPTKHEKKQDKFEFDVAFIKNYQLFALSCSTTHNRGLCKQKLIEANTRATQLGGTEARVALVCMRDDTDSLRSELTEATRMRNVAVFGRRDLIDLDHKIAQWIERND